MWKNHNTTLCAGYHQCIQTGRPQFQKSSLDLLFEAQVHSYQFYHIDGVICPPLHTRGEATPCTVNWEAVTVSSFHFSQQRCFSDHPKESQIMNQIVGLREKEREINSNGGLVILVSISQQALNIKMLQYYLEYLWTTDICQVFNEKASICLSCFWQNQSSL